MWLGWWRQYKKKLFASIHYAWNLNSVYKYMRSNITNNSVQCMCLCTSPAALINRLPRRGGVGKNNSAVSKNQPLLFKTNKSVSMSTFIDQLSVKRVWYMIYFFIHSGNFRFLLWPNSIQIWTQFWWKHLFVLKSKGWYFFRNNLDIFRHNAGATYSWGLPASTTTNTIFVYWKFALTLKTAKIEMCINAFLYRLDKVFSPLQANRY